MHQLRLQRRAVSALYGTMQRQEGAGAPRHSPDVSLRGAKRRGNLGKALPIYTECRRTQSLSNLTVAALSERHGGLQYAPHCLYGARLSDLSLRGAKRRGNLAEPDRTTGKSSAKSQLPSRDCTPRALPRAQGATAPLGPRNDKLGGIAPNNLCRNYCQPVRRSLSAATFFSRAAALCSERRCRPRRGRFPLYRRPVRVGSIAPGPAVRPPAMITPSGPPA